MSRANRMRLNSCHSAKLMLLNLPLPIVIKILSRLPSELVCCIRCMSKDLLSMVDDLYFGALHTRFLIATNAVAQVPQLMSFAAFFPSQRGGVIADLQPVKFDESALTTRGKYAINVSTSRRADCPTYMVDFVFYNLICFRNRNNRGQGVCFLIDLCRREVLRLPKNDITKDSKSPVFCDWYGMGFDSVTNTLKILRVTKVNAADCMVAQVLVLGKSSWRQISSAPLCYLSAICNLFSPKNACAYGDMHWLRGDAMVKESEAIISFDFKKEEFCWTPHPKLRSSKEYTCLYMHLHLLTLKGSLALVDTSSSEGMTTNIDIWLMKDYKRKEWTRDYSISIEMFDLRKEFGRLTDVTCDEWEHGIFFKNFQNMPAFFLDLRSALMNPVRCESGIRTKILSYTRSFISLKDYDILVEAERGTGSLKSYVNLMEEEAQGFSLCERHVLRGVSLIQEGFERARRTTVLPVPRPVRRSDRSYRSSKMYMAPEMLRGSTFYGPGADIWARGCIFAEMLFGHAIFCGDNMRENQLFVISRVLAYLEEESTISFGCLPAYDQPAYHPPYGDTLPPEVLSLLLRMLSFDPANRSSAQECLDDPYFLPQ